MNPVVLRREAVVSGGINAAISAAIFLVLFGSDRPADLDAFASDFLPQSFMVGLAAAIVPVLIVRQRLDSPERTGTILRRAILFAAASLVAGGGAFVLCRTSGPGSLDPVTALAIKMAFGATLGAIVTVAALRRLRTMPEIVS